MTDPIADMLTRIRNATAARKVDTKVPASRLKKAVLDILVAQGYLASYKESTTDAHPTLIVTLIPGKKMTLTRLSRPGQRRYSAGADLKPVQRGEGIAIVSTSKGVMTHIAAKKANVGGEVICEVY